MRVWGAHWSWLGLPRTARIAIASGDALDQRRGAPHVLIVGELVHCPPGLLRTGRAVRRAGDLDNHGRDDRHRVGKSAEGPSALFGSQAAACKLVAAGLFLPA